MCIKFNSSVKGIIAVSVAANIFAFIYYEDLKNSITAWYEHRSGSSQYPALSPEDLKFIDDVGKTSLDNSNEASERFAHRLDRLKEACDWGERKGKWSKSEQQQHLEHWKRNDNFLVVPEKEFLICVMPKCGSTSWHWLVRDMRDPLTVGHVFGWQDRQKNIEIAQQLDANVGLRLLTEKNGVRAISVRHPFGKLISGWNQKFTRDTTYATFILEAYPVMKQFASEKDKTHVLAFEDLMEYLVAYGYDLDMLDYHFLPVDYMCEPCLYPYNVVIKVESLENDATWLANALNVTNLPWKDKGPGYKNSNPTQPEEVIRTYFEKVKPSTIDRLKQLYYYDFALFGYSFDTDSLTAGGFS